MFPLNTFEVRGSHTVQTGELSRFAGAGGWQYAGLFDLERTLEVLQEAAMLYTCRCETLQMQSTRRQMVSLVAWQRQMYGYKRLLD